MASIFFRAINMDYNEEGSKKGGRKMIFVYLIWVMIQNTIMTNVPLHIRIVMDAMLMTILTVIHMCQGL